MPSFDLSSASSATSPPPPPSSTRNRRFRNMFAGGSSTSAAQQKSGTPGGTSSIASGAGATASSSTSTSTSMNLSPRANVSELGTPISTNKTGPSRTFLWDQDPPNFVDMFSALTSESQIFTQQIESGLYALKRLAIYTKKVAQARLAAASTILDATEHEQSKEVNDRMMSTHNAYENVQSSFREWADEEQQCCEGLLRYVVQPLFDFYQEANVRRKELDAERQKWLDEIRALKTKLDAGRQSCFKQWEALTEIGLKLHDSMESREGKRWVAMRKKFEKQMLKTRLAFKAFEAEVEEANTHQDQYYFEWLPEHCRQLERLEVLRINTLHEAVGHVASLTTAFVNPLPAALNPLIKAAKKINAAKDIEQMVRAALKGQRPHSHGFLSKLPCDSDLLQPSPDHDLPPLIMPLLSDNVDELSMRRCMAQQLQRDRRLNAAVNRLQSARESRFSARSLEQNRQEEAEAAALVMVEDIEKMLVVDFVQTVRSIPFQLSPETRAVFGLPENVVLPSLPEGTIIRMTNIPTDLDWKLNLREPQMDRELMGYIVTPLLGHCVSEQLPIHFLKSWVQPVYIGNQPPLTLEHVLAIPALTKCFHAYTAKEFSQENVDFWLAVVDYRRQCGSSAADFLVPNPDPNPKQSSSEDPGDSNAVATGGDAEEDHQRQREGGGIEYSIVLGDDDPWNSRAKKARPQDTIIQSPPVAMAVAPMDDEDDEDEDGDGDDARPGPLLSLRSDAFLDTSSVAAAGTLAAAPGGIIPGTTGGVPGFPGSVVVGTDGRGPSSNSACVLLAESIISRFIHPSAPQQVNLPSHSRRRIMEMQRQGLFTIHMFDQAQLDCFQMLKNDSMSRFVKSSFLNGWLKRFYALLPPEHPYVTNRDRSQFAEVYTPISQINFNLPSHPLAAAGGGQTPSLSLTRSSSTAVGKSKSRRSSSSTTIGRGPRSAHFHHQSLGGYETIFSSLDFAAVAAAAASANPGSGNPPMLNTNLSVAGATNIVPTGGAGNPGATSVATTEKPQRPHTGKHVRRKSFSFSPSLLLRRRKTQSALSPLSNSGSGIGTSAAGGSGSSASNVVMMSPSTSSVSLHGVSPFPTGGSGGLDGIPMSPSFSASTASNVTMTVVLEEEPAGNFSSVPQSSSNSSLHTATSSSTTGAGLPGPPPGPPPARRRGHHRSLSFSQHNSRRHSSGSWVHLFTSSASTAGGPGAAIGDPSPSGQQRIPISKSGSAVLQLRPSSPSAAATSSLGHPEAEFDSSQTSMAETFDSSDSLEPHHHAKRNGDARIQTRSRSKTVQLPKSHSDEIPQRFPPPPTAISQPSPSAASVRYGQM